MSPTSYHCSTPRYFVTAKVLLLFELTSILSCFFIISHIFHIINKLYPIYLSRISFWKKLQFVLLQEVTKFNIIVPKRVFCE
jgi:hypothetical protein